MALYFIVHILRVDVHKPLLVIWDQMHLFEIFIHLEFHMYHLVNIQIMMGSGLLAKLVQLVVLQLPWSLLVYE